MLSQITIKSLLPGFHILIEIYFFLSVSILIKKNMTSNFSSSTRHLFFAVSLRSVLSAGTTW